MTSLAPDAAELRPGASERWRAPGPVVVGVAVSLVALAILLAHNRAVFTTAIYEDGDFALNSILIDRAKDLTLLVGNYSRVGFNHPGPALLYVQALGELAFHDVIPLTPSPYGAHLLGVMILNASLLGVSAGIVRAHTGSLVGPLGLVVIALAYTDVVPGMLSSTWMPDLYVWPFLLLLVAGGSVLGGRRQDLWAAVLAACLLVHGHVSFTLFVGTATVIVAAVLLLGRQRDGRSGVPPWAGRLSVGIIGLFGLPIVANLALDWPGELDDYLRYSGSDSAGGHATADVVSFVKDYWVDGPVAAAVVAGLLVALAAVAAAARSVPGRAFALGALTMVGAMSVAMLVYAARGVDDLTMRYIGRFYLAAPMVALLCALVVLTSLIPSRGLRATALLPVVVLGAWYATRPAVGNPYAGSPWLPAAADAVVAEVGPEIALRFHLHGWPPAAGLVQELRRDGRSVCVDGDPVPLWDVLFTDELVCTPGELAAWPVVQVLPPGTPPEVGDVVANPSVVLRLARG